MSNALGNDTSHVAKKHHQCAYCLTAIVPGERYGRRVGVEGGEMSVMKFHPECDQKAATEWEWQDWEDRDWGEPQFPRPMTAFDPCI